MDISNLVQNKLNLNKIYLTIKFLSNEYGRS